MSPGGGNPQAMRTTCAAARPPQEMQLLASAFSWPGPPDALRTPHTEQKAISPPSPGHSFLPHTASVLSLRLCREKKDRVSSGSSLLPPSHPPSPQTPANLGLAACSIRCGSALSRVFPSYLYSQPSLCAPASLPHTCCSRPVLKALFPFKSPNSTC